MNANTMPLEAATRLLIDRNLENLGWKLTGKDQNVYCEQPRTEAEKKKLGGKRPDYVLYSKESDKPLIVIEAKKKGSRIDTALEQGISYARAIDAPLVFATDGVFCKAFHTVANRPPILNGEEIDEFIREALALRYLTSYEVNTVSPKVQYDRKELIRIFDEANNMLRGEGLRAGIERFGEFANILFLKLISESEQIKRESGIQTKFDIACSWDSIKQIPSSTRIEYINKTVYDKLNALYNTDIFTPLQIRDASILKEIMDKLDPLMLTDVDSDVKGDAFEYFLKASTSTKNDLGEYFTPRHIVKTMVRLVNPQIGETVYDPFCGTGGFLIESFRHVYNNMARTEVNLKTLRESTVYGNEITNTARITKMNMILAGDGHSNIAMKDSLANPVDGTTTYTDENGVVHHNGFDIVLANMPYSQKTKHGSLYDLPSTNGDSICVQHCMKAINSAAENGRMALVVPEGFLFRKDLAKTREYLLDHCQLQSIISLPQGVFLPYTGVKTDIIYATHVNKKVKASEKKKNFWYFDVKSDGYTLDNHRRKLDTSSDLTKYEEYRKLDEEQTADMMKVGFEVIPLDKVRQNSYILVGSRYRMSEGQSKYETVSFSDVATLTRGVNYQKAQQTTFKTKNIILPADNITLAGELDVVKEIYVDETVSLAEEKRLKQNDIFICMSSGSKEHIGKVAYIDQDTNYYAGGFMGIIRTNPNKCLSKYLYFYLLASKKYREEIKLLTQGANINNISSTINSIKIPLPSIEVQHQIISELDGYRQVISGANRIVNNYKTNISINPKWNNIALGDMCEFEYGFTDTATKDGDVRYVRITDINTDGTLSNDDPKYVSLSEENRKFLLNKNDVLVARIGATYGKTMIFDGDQDAIFASYLIRLKFNEKILPKYYFYYAQSEHYWDQAKRLVTGAGQPQFNANTIKLIRVPLPSIEEQQQIIQQCDNERELVKPAIAISTVFANKIEVKVNEVWSE
ncbi:MAG: N-6 DNA methylase [Clostridia bacterium]|nr:N-6 DNA methylase [Clostridia bacterium]